MSSQKKALIILFLYFFVISPIFESRAEIWKKNRWFFERNCGHHELPTYVLSKLNAISLITFAYFWCSNCKLQVGNHRVHPLRNMACPHRSFAARLLSAPHAVTIMTDR